MNRVFASMLCVTVLLVMLVIGTVASVSAQEVTAVEDSAMSDSRIAPDYLECNLTEDQRAAILDDVLAANASLAEYPIIETDYLNCYNSYGYRDDDTTENVTYFYGNLRLMNSRDEPRYMSAYFSGEIMDGKINTTYVSEAWPQYNFESYFTKDENEVLGYYLKMLLIDYEAYGEQGDMDMWLQVNPLLVYKCLASDSASEEIARCPTSAEGIDREKFRAEFEQYVADVQPEDSFYYQNEWTAMGLVRTRLSDVRELMNDWATSISFFGEDLMFSFQGNATISADMDTVLGALKQQGFEVCSPEDSSCDYSSGKVAWYSPEMMGVYAHANYGDTYAYLSLNGRIGMTASLYVGLSGTDVDAHIDDAKALVTRVAETLGIDVGEVEFEDRSTPDIYEKETYDGEKDGPGTAPSAPMNNYRMLIMQKQVTVPAIEEAAFQYWEKEEGAFYTNYFLDDVGVTIGKPYVSYWQQVDDRNYESVQIGEGIAYGSVTIDAPDYQEAGTLLSQKIGQLATVTGEWNLEYSPVGSGGMIPLYRYGILESRAMGGAMEAGYDTVNGAGVPAAAPQAPSLDDSFSKAFGELQNSVSAHEESVMLAPNMVIIALAIIAGMASFIFLLLK